MDNSGVLLVILLLLAFYYACYCREGVRVHSEAFNNLKMMLCNSKGYGLSRTYNERTGADSENRQARSVLTGEVGQNGTESQLTAEVVPADLLLNAQERPRHNIHSDDL